MSSIRNRSKENGRDHRPSAIGAYRPCQVRPFHASIATGSLKRATYRRGAAADGGESMGVGNVSGAATAAVMSQLKGADVRSVVGLAVMRQIQDQQKQMGQEMLDMINSSTPSPNGVGQRIDIRV